MNEIYHGDCLALIPDKIEDDSIDCIVTDPPYGVNFRSRMATTPEGKSWVKEVANDGDISTAISLFYEVMTQLLPKMKENCDLYVFTRWDIVDRWMAAVRSIDPSISYKMLLVWDKGSPGMGDIDANWGCGHELILYCKRGRRDVAYRRSGIIAVERVMPVNAIHPTEKPVPLLERFIEMSTNKGDLVVDPFSGSGSTSVAAQNLGRDSIAFELDDDHHSRSLERLSQDTLFS